MNANIHESTYPFFHAFQEKLRQCTVDPLPEDESVQATPSFVRTQQLKAWLKSETMQERVTNIECLVANAYESFYCDDIYPLVDINNVMETCSSTFCILLELGKGYLIDKFMECDIVDAKLDTIHIQALEDKLWGALEPNTADVQKLVDGFDERRWAYLGHIFKFDQKIELPRSMILPIYKRQRISRQGGTASIHQLCIPAEYLDENMRRYLAKSAYTQEPLGKCFYLAMKTFEEGDRSLFEREIDAYRHLKEQQGMVRFLGAFTHRNQNNRAEHNILLEFGDYDLAEYFQFQPPVLPANVGSFWHNLSHVAAALSSFHNFTRQHKGKKQKMKGWHADLKPDNILSVQGTLKLVDPGFAGFSKTIPERGVIETNIAAMTSTYGPPECYLISQVTQWPQYADIWALACVFSEAATWLILGPSGLRVFSNIRAEAVSRRLEANLRESVSPDDAIIGHGDFWHDGEEVLPEVLQWHAYLRSVVRPTDPIAAHILDLVDNQMLLQEPPKRISASDLSTEMQNIGKQYPLMRPDNLPLLIKNAIQKEETQLTWKPVTAVFGPELSIQDRKSLKPKAFAGLSSAEAGRISDKVKQAIQLRNNQSQQSLSENRQRVSSRTLTLQTGPETLQRVSGSQAHPSAPSAQAGAIAARCALQPQKNAERKHTAQSIFDAHYNTILSDETNRGKGKLLRVPFRKEKRNSKTVDGFLERHYVDRDIKFVVDNAATMREEWFKVTFVLEKLAQKAAWIDKDGMDLEAVDGSETKKIQEASLRQDIKAFMESSRVKPRRDSSTDMSKKLGEALFNWLQGFQRDSQNMKKLTLIILTDGRWTGMQNPQGVEEVIVRFDKNLKLMAGNNLLKRCVSIQFISFGDDPDALYRLRHLDNDLKYDRSIEDIVDTEHYDGDVYKMLLGSFVEGIDCLDAETTREDTESPQSDRQSTFDQQPGHYGLSPRAPTSRQGLTGLAP